jgi:hypothetical protein
MPTKTKPKQRIYCVHVYEQPHIYENIKASSPEDAEDKVMRAENFRYDDINNVEVMVQCQTEDCGLDNDVADKLCESCGNKL